MFFTIASFVVNILNYLFNFLAAQGLGPKMYSEITSLFSYISIFAVPMVVFSNFLIQKLSARGRGKFIIAKSLEDFFWLKIKKWSFALICILLLTPFISRITNLSMVTGAALLPMIFLFLFGSFYNSMFQGLHMLFIFGLISIFAVSLKFSGALLVYLGFDGMQTIILFLLISSIVPLLLSILILRSYFSKTIVGKVPKIEKKIFSIIKDSQFIIIFLSTLALTLLNNVDIVFVKKVFSAHDAGIYSSWSLFAKMIFYAVGPLIAIGFIFFSSREHQKHHDITLRISLLMLFAVTIISYTLYSNFGDFLVTIFFGSKFVEVLPYLSKASLFGSFFTGISFMSYYFVAKKSYYGLILPLLIPFYVVSLFFIKKELSNIMDVNILFSLVVAVIYVGVYLKDSLDSNSKSS